MNDFDIHSLVAAYALDALEPHEIELFDAHLPDCDRCQAELVGFSETAALLADANSVEPPPGIRDALLANVSQTRQLPPIVSDETQIEARASQPGNPVPAKLSRGMLTLAAAVLIVGGAFAARSITTDDRVDEIASVVDASDAIEIALVGEQGELTLTYSQSEGQVALLGEGLEALSDDQTYELWGIDDDGARSAGQFRTNDDGVVEVVLATAESTDITWGVTIEPAGGSLEPTAPVLYMST